MGQLLIALLAAAYYFVGPVVVTIGVTGAVFFAVVSGVGGMALQIGGGLLGGRLTAAPSAPGRALGWVTVAIGVVGAGAAILVSLGLAAAVVAVLAATEGRFELPT